MKRKINIGLFNDAFYPMIDGVVSVVDNYARLLSKKANVVVFAPNYKNKEFDDSKLPYKVVRVKSIRIPKLDYVLPVPKLDIVHIHSPATIGMTAIKYAKANNIPIIGTMHSQCKQDFKNYTHSKLLTKIATKEIIKLYEECNECWAVNNGISRLFHDEYGYSKYPIVMTNATEMRPVKNINKAHKVINERHNLDENIKVFLFVGRLYRLKNIFFIIDALKELDKRNVDFKYKMLYVGSGGEEENLKKYIHDNFMDDKVILCGRVENRELLSYYYSRADLFLFPSMYDANSIVQIEASSQKKPTIFLKDAITASDIIDNETGFLSIEDPAIYAEKIDEVMHNKKLYHKVANNAYKKVYKTWEDITDEAYDRYLEVIANNENKKV